MLTVRTDEHDGAPMWSCLQGSKLPGGFLAWDRIGIGPRYETWLVWSVPLWSPAVLKLPRPHQIHHPRVRRSLAREVAALSGNPHPALPRLYTDATGADPPFITTEYIDGPALREDIAANGPLDEDEVALLGAQLLTGLNALHQRGIAHLDIRPDNVVLRDMRPVLTDFGSARRIGAALPVGHPVGTPGYAAPELAPGARVTVGMDLYALGVTLLEALTGGAPTAALPGNSELVGLVRALIDPDPARRPSTPRALTALATAVPDDLRPWPSWADPAAGPAR
ncbi:MAG TPA: serine/threonine-protein kinase [Actinophytocola sp.]|uniref:serine/threonine-protein kinase n=1 Tax=Actinophytocola sp. TaxID=1872138 RepID=UPI002DBB97EF|nr:serine/threonine-protein kinase [Actinophytocola sp.]HEU5472482.1 serine/threonine-protein kinase [Actinophytocola sp.]